MNSTSKTLLIIVIIMTIVLGWLIYNNFQQKNEQAKTNKELVEVKSDKAAIEEELEGMIVRYDGLKTDNEELNVKLETEKQKIKETLEQLKRVKRNDRVKIKLLQEETETLKSIMKDFVKQIDELNTENIRLVSENSEIRQNYDDEMARTETLTYLKDSLSTQVKKAKELKAENISVEILNIRDNITNRASKLHKVKVCFTIDNNVLAAKGTRNSYMRIAAPDGIILLSKESGMFNYQGKEIAFSSKRELTYEGKKTNVCVFWTADSEQAPGKYSIDIFMDGSQIGEQKFSLK